VSKNIIDLAAARVLLDIGANSHRDQNASILRDRLREFGLNPADPATVRGALAGILMVREHITVVYGPGMLVLPGGDLFNVPVVMAGIEGLAVMVDQHQRAGR